MTEEALKVCPKEKCPCKPWGKGKVKRVIGAGAGLIFKGSGFYITDYRSESYKEAAKKDASAATSSSSEKSSSSSDSSKPAATPKTEAKKEKKPSSS